MAVTRKLRSVKSSETAAPSPEPGAACTTVDTPVGNGSVCEVVPDDSKPNTPLFRVPSEDADSPVPAGVIGGTLPTNTAVVPASPSAVAVPRSMNFAANSGLSGDWDQSDIKFPVLRIVSGSGELSKLFNAGTVILGDEAVLPPPDLRAPNPAHTFRFVPIAIAKQFRENLTQEEAQSGQIPRVVDTLEEVEALGGTTQWINNQKPSWGPSARCLLLVERPEGLPGFGTDHPGFSLEIDGKLYAPAVLYAAGTMWTSFAKVIFNAALTTLMIIERDEAGNPLRNERGGIVRTPYLPKAYWSWRTVKRQAGDFSVFASEIRLTRDETSEELRSMIETIRS